MIIADALLIWRCYILWRQNKILLVILCALLVGEMVPNAGSGIPAAAGPTLYYVSVGITAIASGLIIYRIIDVTKRSGGAGGRYTFTIEVIVESGALYLITLLIASVLLSEINTAIVYSDALLGAWMYFYRASIPITVGDAYSESSI
ncbi:hypothetical protein D9619_003893 [Psilocybe cf. subviscida]|uniref:Uncharacterized protein n=1 Tax=Psilocybe cf. subviscida TaxID=2480587 RepID=A0A8H5BPY3_9AGAR|nr:hypothetical protein D9619_003893 [Psilocybe cf. subviscida]